MDAKATQTIPECCDDNNLSRSLYYELQAKGHGPDEIRLGRKVIITNKSGDRWRERMEKMTAEAAAA